MIRKSNRYLFDIGRRAIEVELHHKKVEINRDNCMQLLDSQYENSSADQYREIIWRQRLVMSE